MKINRRLTFILVAMLLALTGITPVEAHAMLVSSTPAENASLSTSPEQVVLVFSEAVAPKLSRITVMDRNGKAVNAGDAQVDPLNPNQLTVGLNPLEDGIYVVVWNVISASDGHQTNGSFPFAVGQADASALMAANSQASIPTPPAPIGDMLLKGLLYVAAAALMGGILFTFLVWDPSLRKAQIIPEEPQAYEKFSRKFTLGVSIVLVMANLLSLMVQSGLTSGNLVSWPWQPEFTAMLTTRVGLLGVLRFALAALLAVLLLPRRTRWNRWAGLFFSLLLLLTFSLESHAAGDAQPLLPVLADWVHIVAVSVWVGGLFSFMGGMRLVREMAPEPRTRLTAFLIPHFTTLALISVGTLILTGIYAALLRVGTPAALLDSTYGQALIVKLAIAAPMLVLGGINFLYTSPSMRRAAARPGGCPAVVKRFYGLLSAEVSLGIVILIWVGVFTTLPPARFSAMQAGFNQTTTADDIKVRLSIDPGLPGNNTFTALITSGGQPVTNVGDVSLEFTSLTGMVPDSKAAMTNQGNGKYSLQGGYLAMPDRWDIKVVVIRRGKFDAYADFKFDTSQAGDQPMP